jgi:oxygen-independent coproporphyrinogen-3 oxidase
MPFGVLPPLSLYVHLPWCVRKCPYCDFNSHEARGPLAENAYVAALLADLDAALPGVQGRELQSIFIGGGTPSLFSAAAIGRLIDGVRERVAVAAAAEITIEANPGTAEAEKFHGFRAAGVTRLSLGVQSFESRHLNALGRIHDGSEARHAVALALAAFDNVNLDLMYALPGQTPAEARADAATAVAMGVPHLSFYQLTIEPNTVFYGNPPELPDEETAAAIEAAAHAELAGSGFRRYEISAWSRPGRECRHNLNYWQFGDYLGIGAGAHAKITYPDRIEREARTRAPADYLRRAVSGDAVAERRTLSTADAAFEFMMNALRLTDGFDVALFDSRAGQPIANIDLTLAAAVRRRLVLRQTDRITPTLLGLDFLNELTGLFLPEPAHGPGAAVMGLVQDAVERESR